MSNAEMRKAASKAEVKLLKAALGHLLQEAADEAMKKPKVREALIRSIDPDSPQAKHRKAFTACLMGGAHGGPLIEPGEEVDDCIARVSGISVVRDPDGVVSYE
jgi:hypothetical protein